MTAKKTIKKTQEKYIQQNKIRLQPNKTTFKYVCEECVLWSRDIGLMLITPETLPCTNL